MTYNVTPTHWVCLEWPLFLKLTTSSTDSSWRSIETETVRLFGASSEEDLLIQLDSGMATESLKSTASTVSAILTNRYLKFYHSEIKEYLKAFYYKNFRSSISSKKPETKSNFWLSTNGQTMLKLKTSLTCSELCKEKVDTDFIFGTMTKDTMSRYFLL